MQNAWMYPKARGSHSLARLSSSALRLQLSPSTLRLPTAPLCASYHQVPCASPLHPSASAQVEDELRGWTLHHLAVGAVHTAVHADNSNPNPKP